MSSIWKELLFLHGHFANLEDILTQRELEAVNAANGCGTANERNGQGPGKQKCSA